MMRLQKILKSNRGAVAVLIALALPVLLGIGALAVDVGYLYLNRTQLRSAADAAALAGAQELPKNPTAAQTAARDYAGRNGKTSDVVTVTISADSKSIEVKIDRVAPLFLAKIMNASEASVSAKSKAQVSVAASVPWIVPFVIPKTQFFDYDHVFTMRMYNASKPYGTYEFDYMNVGIENTDFNTYIQYLKYGYQKEFTVGNNMQYLGPSSGGQASVDAFADRVARDPNTDYTKAKVGDPRVMLVPLVDSMLSRNTAAGTPMKIVGFVGYFLESVYKGSYGTTFYAKLRFLKDLNVGSGSSTSNPIYDFGVRTIQLVQ